VRSNAERDPYLRGDVAWVPAFAGMTLERAARSFQLPQGIGREALRHGPEEGALEADDAAGRVGVAHGRLTFGIGRRLGAVLLVGGEGGKGEGGERNVARALAPHQVSLVPAAEAIDERD